MRRRPLLVLGYVVAVLFVILPTPIRDALEVAIQAQVARLRHLADGDASPTAPPGLRPEVRAFLDREYARVGSGSCARVVQLRTRGDREHVIVDRGRRHGVAPGDLAVMQRAGDPAFVLAGEVDRVADDFARVRTLGDAEAWWMARAPSGRLILESRIGERGLRIVDPEHRRALQIDVARRRTVVTAADASGSRAVPEGLGIGTLVPGGESEGESFWVDPILDAHRTLGVRLQRGARVLRFEARTRHGRGTWQPARVRQVWDANPRRASMLIGCAGSQGPPPEDAPVARGVCLEGWVHTVAGSHARVRLVEDPGFYTQVLVLRQAEGQWTSPGGGVFRGGSRQGGRLRGRVEKMRDLDLRPGDLLVVGPHKGGGGIGLMVGEVVHSEAGGLVTLRRPARPRRGDVLWVGRFARPPRDLVTLVEGPRSDSSR